MTPDNPPPLPVISQYRQCLAACFNCPAIPPEDMPDEDDVSCALLRVECKINCIDTYLR